MKKNAKMYLVIIAATAILAVIAFVAVQRSGAAALSVNDVGADPSAYSGVITVTGIVAGVSQQDPSIIGMMDKRELQCTAPNCKKIYLPFRAVGYSPVRGDEVRVTGRFLPLSEGYIFMADNVTVVKNHKIGG